MTNQPIIVTGMHRSGTSLVMSFLENLGIYCGSHGDMLSPSEENPRGYWENTKILSFNDSLLNLLGASWDDLDELSPFSELPQNVQSRLVHDGRKLIESIYGKQDHWGVKDPRFSLLMPFWKILLPNVKQIVCVRNPIEVALSLSNRFSEYHIKFEKGLRLWKDYNQCIANQENLDDVLFVDYDALFSDVDAVLSRIIHFIYCDQTAGEELITKAKKDFLQKGRHYAFSDQGTNAFLNDKEFKVLYGFLRGKSCSQTSTETVSLSPSQVSAEVFQIQELVKMQKKAYQYFALAEGYANKNDYLRDQEQSILQLRHQIQGLQKSISSNENEKKVLLEQITSFKNEKKDLLKQVAKVGIEKEEKIARVESENEKKIEQFQSEKQAILLDTQRVAAELENANKKLNESELEIERVKQALNEAHIELANLQDELAQTKGQFNQVQNDLADQIRDSITYREQYAHFESMSVLLNDQLQGILNSRTWKTLQRIRHYVGKVAPSLLISPYDSSQSVVNQVSTPVFVPSKFSIYAEHDSNVGVKQVLYVYPPDKSLFASCMYRVHNIGEYFEASSTYKYESITSLELLENPDYINGFDILVFFRLPMSLPLGKIIQQANQRRIICCYDIDDYVFDLSIFQFVNPLREFDHKSLSAYFDGINRYRDMVLNCDYFIASTPYLASMAEKLGKSAYVIPNGLNHHQENVADRVLASENTVNDDWIRIGYLSGTNTHDKDFLIVKDALLRILSEFPKVKLSIRGILSLPEDFDVFANQVEFLPFVPFDQLLEKTDILDILIAPLEINPYTEAKSDLKYFEPALLQKPVIASPTGVFTKAITDGENGFIASNGEDWYEKIKSLVSNEELRTKLGLNARNHSLAHYSVEAQNTTVHEVFNAIWGDYFRCVEGPNLKSLSVSWVVPVPAAGSGGHRVIFEICEHLVSAGHDVTIHFLPASNFQNADQLREFITEQFFEMKSQIELGINEISVCDALIATSWNTAATVANNIKLARDGFYFVQDFEPFFFPMSSDYIAAFGTYSMGLKHITIGDWLRKKLEEDFSATARSFPFPIDHELYFPGDSEIQQKKIQLAFFARNTMARRCYPLGVEALKVLKQKYPSVEIILFGSNEIDPADFPYQHTNFGVITPQQLADLYRESIVGLSFSTTNPSIVPFEMMACGLPVVDLDFNQNDIHYGGLENVTLAQPNPTGIADAVISLIEDQKNWQGKRENGIKFAEVLPTRIESARLFEEILLQYLAEDEN